MYKLISFTNGQDHYMDACLSFLSLTAEIYKDDKNYIPEKTADVLAWLSGTHKCAGFLEQMNLLVVRDHIPAARGIAFVNTIGNFGSIGFFECLDDAEAVRLLVDGAKSFCKEREITKIYAPMNGSIWSDYRLMTRSYEDKPFPGEPYNMPYYGDLLIKCGFKVIKKWETQFVEKIKPNDNVARRYLREEKAQQSKGIKIRSMKNFDTGIRVIHKLAMNAFTRFFLFHELSEDDFVNIYDDLKFIYDKKTIKIAYNADEQPIGFGIALPEYKSKMGFITRYAKRYIFLYIGTLQENGESVYPQCGKAIIVSILKTLFLRRKSYIRAMMGEDTKTRGFSNEYDGIHEYALYELEVD